MKRTAEEIETDTVDSLSLSLTRQVSLSHVSHSFNRDPIMISQCIAMCIILWGSWRYSVQPWAFSWLVSVQWSFNAFTVDSIKTLWCLHWKHWSFGSYFQCMHSNTLHGMKNGTKMENCETNRKVYLKKIYIWYGYQEYAGGQGSRST